MKRRMTIWILLAAAVVGPATADAADTDLCNVGGQRQLFIDEAFFDTAFQPASNISLRLHPGKKTGEKVLQYDKPWESATLNWFNVLQEPGVVDKQAKYRMWYECYDLPGWPTADDTSFCYAESRDGIHWTKPELGLFDYHGSKKNNILFRQIGEGDCRSRVHGTGIFVDPTAPSEARYKAVSQGIWKNAAPPPQRIAGMTSPDGLRWTRLPQPICDVFADSQDACFWDQGLKKYVLFGRVGGNIGRAESPDFAHFEPLQLVLSANDRDPPNSNLYNSAVVKYSRAAHVYLMFPSLYQHGPDTLDIRLAVSRDGVHWTYPDQTKALIPLGEAGAWDSGSLYIGQGVVQNGDQTWLYYSGAPLKHNATDDELFHTKQPRAFSFVTLGRDRFVSVEGGQQVGSFVTRPLWFTGDALKLNVNVRPGGHVCVGLLDEKGQTLPGRDVKDCLPITGDHFDAVVRWKDGADVGTQAGRPTRMKIELVDASLFGFQFATDLPSGLPAAGSFRLWQVPPSTTKDVMMSYVVQSPRGQLIVIDGGWEGDAPYLRRFLHSLGGRVHTWFITHQHDDHLGALTAILRQPEGIQIGRIYASLLSERWIRQHEPDQAAAAHGFNAAVAESGKSVVAPRPGDTLSLDGLGIEILAVGDETVNDPNNYINNQCMVLRLATPGTSILFLADLGAAGGQRLLARNPDGQRLRSQYVQMAHHGQNGVDRRLYKAVHARYALWPTPRWLYELPSPALKAAYPTGEVRQWMTELGVGRNYVMKDGLIEVQLPVQPTEETTARR